MADSHATQLWNTLVDPAVRSWLESRGFVMGDWDGRRNLAEVIKDQAFQKQLNEAMGVGAQGDRRTYERLMRGFATLAGQPWNSKLQALSERVSGDIAAIAPHVMRWAPDVWDDLHGSAGSMASLTRSIAEAHRGRMEPGQAAELAKGVFDDLFQGDPLKTKGFSAKDFGQMYGELAKRGRIPPSTDPKVIAKQLSDYAGPLSAIRDSLNSQREQPAEATELFDVFDATPKFNGDLGQLEQKLRAGHYLDGQGGAFSAAVQAVGPLKDSLDLRQLEAQNAALSGQAAQSPLGNMLGATQRLSTELGFADNSPAAAMLQQMQAGQFHTLDPQAWTQAMEASGIDPVMAREALSMQGANANSLTPELIDGVRRSQMATDIQPRVDQAMSSARQRAADPQQADRMLPMIQNHVATQMGYRDWDELNALHGPNLQQGMPTVMGRAQANAQHASAMSGIGAAGPWARMSDAVQNATPQTGIHDLVGAGLNIIPQNKIPAPPQ